MIYTDDQIISQAFEYFRTTGFPFRNLPVHVCMQELNKLSQLSDEQLDTSNLGYQVADTFHPERFLQKVTGMKTPIDAFYDDKILTRCLTRMLTKGTGIKQTLIGGVGGIAITSGVQAPANFRPAFALKFYRRFCKDGDVVLDTSAGYGGRLLGAMAMPNITYIGVDPSADSYNGNMAMIHKLGLANRVTLIKQPIEDLPELCKDGIDFAFTSPPYYAKELYSEEETQSSQRYKTGEEWKEKFLRKMFEVQYAALKEGKYSVVNIQNVTIKRVKYNLVDWAAKVATETGFQLESTEYLTLQKRIGKGHETSEKAQETVLIFKK